MQNVFFIMPLYKGMEGVYEKYNVKNLSLDAPFTYEFDDMLCVTCMSWMASKLTLKNALGSI
jgi:hypothetical protein